MTRFNRTSVECGALTPYPPPEMLACIVARALEIDRSDVDAPGRQPSRVQARSLFCYWAVRELGITTTALADRFGLSQPAISLAVQRGEKLVAEYGWHLENFIGR
jgi:putative transposase